MLLGLAACASQSPAPVTDLSGTRGSDKKTAPPKNATAKPTTPQIAASTNGLHTVQRGDTLYAIAFANSLDYREIAAWNRLDSPDLILVGQVLRLTPPPGAVEVVPLDDEPEPEVQTLAETPVLREPQAVLLPYSEGNWAKVSGRSPAPAQGPSVAATPAPAAAAASVPAPAATPAAVATPVVAKPGGTEPPAVKPAIAAAQSPSTPAAASKNGRWLWPTEGTLAGRFGAGGGKGIDIVGARNTPVVAVAPGKVVYSGSGLRGYGKLLIIKHAGEYLSAYAHNDSILVKEGDSVTAGQKIALMGDSDSERVKLHFEIRRYGKPLDPLNYLPERS